MRVERDSQIMRVLELGEIRMALWGQRRETWVSRWQHSSTRNQNVGLE